MAGKRQKFVIWSPEYKNFFAELEVVTIQTLMGGVKSRIDQIRRNDIIGNDHKLTV